MKLRVQMWASQSCFHSSYNASNWRAQWSVGCLTDPCFHPPLCFHSISCNRNWGHRWEDPCVFQRHKKHFPLRSDSCGFYSSLLFKTGCFLSGWIFVWSLEILEECPLPSANVHTHSKSRKMKSVYFDNLSQQHVPMLFYSTNNVDFWRLHLNSGEDIKYHLELKETIPVRF